MIEGLNSNLTKWIGDGKKFADKFADKPKIVTNSEAKLFSNMSNPILKNSILNTGLGLNNMQDVNLLNTANNNVDTDVIYKEPKSIEEGIANYKSTYDPGSYLSKIIKIESMLLIFQIVYVE